MTTSLLVLGCLLAVGGALAVFVYDLTVRDSAPRMRLVAEAALAPVALAVLLVWTWRSL